MRVPNQISIANKAVDVEIVARRPELLVRIDEVVHTLASYSARNGEIDFTFDGERYRGWRCRSGNELHVQLNGATWRVQLADGSPEAGRASAHQEVRADMPGILVALHCEPGQALKSGDKLLTMESMKLQVTLVASHDAIVDRVHVGPNAVFERGALLVSFAHTEHV